MGGRQLLKLGAPTAAAALVAATGWPVPAAQAATGIIRVPCRAPALAAALNAATSGETLSLAAGCHYRLGRALPAIGHDLTIQGHRATLEPAAGAAAFTLLTLAGGTVRLYDLDFTGGQGAITVTGRTASLTVTGGRFTGNHATGGGAIYCGAAAGSLTVTGASFTGNSSAARPLAR
jgi:predicted outer membrane repeat protein